VLSELPPLTDPNILVGTQTADDAAVYRLTDELALVQSVDFFTPVVEDPYTFGAIAAANSLSDIYAMGARPAVALNVVAFPRASEAMPLSVLREILRGGADKAREAGIEIAGGHTIDDPKPKYGLCVTGLAHPEEIWRNTGGRPGDRLILTKPLGTGIITSAMGAAKAPVAIQQAAIATMSTLNRQAAEIAARATVRACTDVTGFGLLGHLREMLGDAVGARIHLGAIPVIAGTRDLAGQGCVSGGTKRNKTSLECVVTYDPRITAEEQLILCDAQTSGGLLLAVPPAEAEGLARELHAAEQTAALIGELTAGPVGKIAVDL